MTGFVSVVLIPSIKMARITFRAHKSGTFAEQAVQDRAFSLQTDHYWPSRPVKELRVRNGTRHYLDFSVLHALNERSGGSLFSAAAGKNAHALD